MNAKSGSRNPRYSVSRSRKIHATGSRRKLAALPPPSCPSSDNRNAPEASKSAIKRQVNRDRIFQGLLDEVRETAAAWKKQLGKTGERRRKMLQAVYDAYCYYLDHPTRSKKLRKQCKSNGMNVTRRTDLALLLFRQCAPGRNAANRWASIARQARHEKIPKGTLAIYLTRPGRGENAMVRKNAARNAQVKALSTAADRSTPPVRPAGDKAIADQNARQKQGLEIVNSLLNKKGAEYGTPTVPIHTDQKSLKGPVAEALPTLAWRRACREKWQKTPDGMIYFRVDKRGPRGVIVEIEAESNAMWVVRENPIPSPRLLGGDRQLKEDSN